jgi:LacI family transcriptional regulator, repressor for deo operon, udp, cdd, tsx, nupC, and nupG
MTVSRVIKKSGYVSAEKRLRVEKAIKDSDYRPNRIARTLASNKSDIIIAVVPDIENAFFTEMVKGTQEVTDANGYNIILCDSRGKIDKEKADVSFAMERMADGVLLFCPRADDEYISGVSKKIPLVVVDRKVEDPDVGQVYIDNKEGARLAVEYLISQGHRRIGLMEGPSNVLANRRRRLGYKEALRKHGIAVEDELIVDGLFSFEGGTKALDRYLMLKRRPTAIFSTNDWMALGFIQRAHERDISIPDDISIIGFDDIILSRLINPSLTTVNHPKVEMGRVAAYQLLSKLNAKVEIPLLEMKNELILRNSVKKIRAARR